MNKELQTKSSTERNEEYIQKLAPSLPRFEKVKDGVYKFRCVFCGDSKKNPNKIWVFLYHKQLTELSLFQVQPQKFLKKCIAGIETRIVYGIYAGGNIKQG
jgi:hypothetical protein